MKLKGIYLAVLLATATSANAGNFVSLTSGIAGSLSAANGGLQNGANSSGGDKFYIQNTGATYVAGFDSTNSAGEVVAQTLNYRAFTGVNTTSTGTLTLLDWSVTRGVDLSPGSKQFDYFDYVYRDSADNKLVFGTRALNQVANNEEANFFYRYGFSGFTTASAWTNLTDFDLRQYQAGLTNSLTTDPIVSLDTNVVRQKSDVNVDEGNPWSGLFLVKTDAQFYTTGAQAIGFAQAGQEGQSVVRGSIAGFVASATDPVAEAAAAQQAAAAAAAAAAQQAAQAAAAALAAQQAADAAAALAAQQAADAAAAAAAIAAQQAADAAAVLAAQQAAQAAAAAAAQQAADAAAALAAQAAADAAAAAGGGTTPGLNLPPVAAVPEPETYAMLLAGLGLIGFTARRRKAM
jgi:hypothetical protein